MGDNILKEIRQQEITLLKSISWISIGTAFLYAFGYAWHFFYYLKFSIPVSLINIPTAQIMFPQIALLFLMAGLVQQIPVDYFTRFYINKKREIWQRNIGLTVPIKEVQDYSLKSHRDIPLKTNFLVFCEKANEYITQMRVYPDRKIDFTKEMLKNFNDIPFSPSEDFVKYCLELIPENENETYKIIVRDVIGYIEDEKTCYDKIAKVFYFFIMLLLILASFFSSLWGFKYIVYYNISVYIGSFVLKMSKTVIRWKFWNSICIVIIIILSAYCFDGYITATQKIINKQLSYVEVCMNNGEKVRGALIGSFTDGYVILHDPVDALIFTKYEKQSVKSISWLYGNVNTIKNIMEYNHTISNILNGEKLPKMDVKP